MKFAQRVGGWLCRIYLFQFGRAAVVIGKHGRAELA